MIDSGMTVRLLPQGYAVASQYKVPLLAGPRSVAAYDDGTDVRVRNGMVVVCFQGVGTLRVGHVAELETEPDESCVLGGLNVEWANKGVRRYSGYQVVFDDGSSVVGEAGRAVASMVGRGLLVFRQVLLQDENLHGYC